jgi:cardiolipin synthase
VLRHLPNLLSALRLAGAPYAAWLIWRREYEWALLAFLLLGFTDFLDGFLARRWRLISRAGSYLDPVADKAMLVGAYLALGLDRVIAPWLMWLVLGRDLVILAMAAGALAFTRHRDYPPSRWGKVSTVLQIAYGATVLLNRSMLVPENGAGPVERVLLYGTALVTAASGAHYVWRAARTLRSPAA